MRLTLGPYSEYCDSALPWLGKMPVHWRVIRNAHLFTERRETGHPDLPILEVSLQTGVTVRTFTDGRKQVMSVREAYKRAAKGDIAYNMMRMWQGAVGVAPVDGLVSPAYVVARPLAGIDSRYYAYLFRTAAYMTEVNKYSHGIVTDRNRLYWDEFKQMPSPFPTAAEQTAIADFLDWHGKQVLGAIRAKRQLIDLLVDQKQAIIDRALTRGLLDNVRLKPSGIAWLDRVPEEWEIRPLKHWAYINQRALPETTDPDFEFRYIDIGSVGTGFLATPPESLCFRDAPSRARRLLRRGDTIVSTVRTYLKAIYYVSEDAPNLVASTGFAALTPRPILVPEYLGFAIQAKPFMDQLAAESIGVAYPAIAETRLAGLRLAIPPNQEEQGRIVGVVKRETASLDDLIARTNQSIAVLHEYRTQLIAGVITGRLDVRNADLKDDLLREGGEEDFAEEAVDADE